MVHRHTLKGVILVEKFRELGGKTAAVGTTLFGVVLMSLALAPGANAAPGDDPGLDAITDFGTKVGTYGAALIAVVVIAAGIMLGAKYVRKAASKG